MAVHPNKRQSEVVHVALDEHPVRVRLRHSAHDGVVFDVWIGEEGEVVRYAVGIIEGGTQPLGARVGLRAPYGEIISHALDYVLHNIGFEIVADTEPGTVPPLATRLAERPGRRSRALTDYAEVARAYVAALEDEKTRNRAVETAADALGISRKSTSNALSRARERGLLTRPRKQGAAGGRLTKKAKDLLEGTEDGSR